MMKLVKAICAFRSENLSKIVYCKLKSVRFFFYSYPDKEEGKNSTLIESYMRFLISLDSCPDVINGGLICLGFLWGPVLEINNGG